MVPGGSQTEYIVVTNKQPYDADFLKEELGIDIADTKGQLEMISDSSYKFNLTPEELDKLKKLPNYVSSTRHVENYVGMTFPNDEANYPWSIDNFGPLRVPAKGDTLHLTTQNIPIYRRLIATYEHNTLEEKDGKFFINGEAGDRFAVRNSGAMAVVEGVGDFACEYMTNGAVLNIGGFGKGFCNGMSGGNAYQYDPENLLENLYDKTSVALHSLTEETETARAHEQFILAMLEQHADYANSSKSKLLLENWATERKHFKFAMPLWLYKTQATQFLQQSLDRKEMVEELSQALAQKQIEQVKKAYKTAEPLFGGAIPGHDANDESLTFKLVNSFAVLEKAQQCARDLLKHLPENQRTQTEIERGARKLIMERPRKLQEALVKSTREAYSNYSDDNLAVLLADKRLNDYKTALINRSVQSIYSIGSTAWIIDQDKINKQALVGIPCIEEYLAGLLGLGVVQDMSNEQAA